MDFVFAAKIVGAVLIFGFGIWLGLGMPGLKRPGDARPWRSADRLRATWMNRVFFNTGKAPRRFDASRLVAPKESHKPSSEGEGEPEKPVVRLRR